MTARLFVDSDNGVTILPEWNLRMQDKKLETQHRTKSGRLFVYKWGDYKAWRLSAEFVSSADAAIINSWWASNTQLLFMPSTSAPTEIYSVMIRSKKLPMSKFNKPYDDLYKGRIDLETY